MTLKTPYRFKILSGKTLSEVLLKQKNMNVIRNLIVFKRVYYFNYFFLRINILQIWRRRLHEIKENHIFEI